MAETRYDDNRLTKKNKLSHDGNPSLYHIGSTENQTLFGDIFMDEGKAILFLIEKGLINKTCPQCGSQSDWKKKWVDATESGGYLTHKDCLKLRCKGLSRHNHSPFRCTFWGLTRIPKHKALLLVFLWSTGATIKVAQETIGLHRNTGSQIYKFLRESCGGAAIQGEEEVKLGGPSIIVEIDESKFGKRKYNRGRRVKGCWVFGMIERILHEGGKYKAGKFVTCVVKKRNEVTLRALIERYILPGSIICSDEWAAYRNIDTWMWLPPFDGAIIEKRYLEHNTVCHERGFKADDGTHTNTIEGHWRISKAKIPKKYFADAETVQEHLNQHIWERQWSGRKWEGILHVLKQVRYDPDESTVTIEDPEDSDNSINWQWQADEEEKKEE